MEYKEAKDLAIKKQWNAACTRNGEWYIISPKAQKLMVNHNLCLADIASKEFSFNKNS